MHIFRRIAAVAASLLMLQPAVITAGSAAAFEPVIVYEENGYIMGDVSGNEQLEVLDVVMLQAFLLGRDMDAEMHLSRADMNHDGVLNVFDLVLLKRAVLGMIDSEWIEKPEEITYEPVTVNVEGAESADITFSGVPGAEIIGTVVYMEGVDEFLAEGFFNYTLDENGK